MNNNFNYYIEKLEKNFSKYVGTKYAIATSSCTGAMHIVLKSQNIGPGDEVIVPDITWVAQLESLNILVLPQSSVM